MKPSSDTDVYNSAISGSSAYGVKFTDNLTSLQFVTLTTAHRDTLQVIVLTVVPHSLQRHVYLLMSSGPTGARERVRAPGVAGPFDPSFLSAHFQAATMKRICQIIRVRPERFEEYCKVGNSVGTR